MDQNVDTKMQLSNSGGLGSGAQYAAQNCWGQYPYPATPQPVDKVALRKWAVEKSLSLPRHASITADEVIEDARKLFWFAMTDNKPATD